MVKRGSRIRNLINISEDGVSPNQILSSEESSGTEYIEEEKPWPPLDHQPRCKTLCRQVTRRDPRPQSHLFRRGPGDGHERRSRHSRRWENSAFLSSLMVVMEDESATPLPEHHSPLTQLHSSEKHMQVWTSFSSRTEEEQRLILEGVRGGECDPASPHADTTTTTAQDSFRKIDRRIRSVLQHNRHLPMELLSSLEEELRFLFTVDHGSVVLSTHSHAYSRLLLHGLCQYMGLNSTTVNAEGVSVVMVTGDGFSPPRTWLTSYLKN
ncbi:R3H domain-containing protein 4-like isoform X1 [Halichondria panicea]|uniref:R3H domain-containing protein 4-like isoform X1 n=1 Tax=Halichondria panicea TaxID=6063 RepID=UPI00312BABE2